MEDYLVEYLLTSDVVLRCISNRGVKDGSLLLQGGKRKKKIMLYNEREGEEKMSRAGGQPEDGSPSAE